MSNSSYSVVCDFYSNGSIVSQIIAHVATSLFALIGNCLVIVIYLQKKYKDRTVVDGLIVNMAVSDLLVPIMILPRKIHDTMNNSTVWIVDGVVGEILCRLVSYMGDIVTMVSTLSLCFITIERFVMVVIFGSKHPFQYLGKARNKRVNQVLIAASWIIPMVFDFHIFFTFRLYHHPITNQTFCRGPIFPKIQHYHIYNTISCILFIFVPFVILLTLNTALVIKLRQMFRSLSTAADDSKADYLKRLQKQRHVKNLMISITVVFGLCWGPLYILTILFTFYWKLRAPQNCSFVTFTFIAFFLARANSAINPWIYIGFQKKRRVRFTSLIQSFPLKGRVAPQSAAQ